jgi:hypothetical protein
LGFQDIFKLDYDLSIDSFAFRGLCRQKCLVLPTKLWQMIGQQSNQLAETNSDIDLAVGKSDLSANAVATIPLCKFCRTISLENLGFDSKLADKVKEQSSTSQAEYDLEATFGCKYPYKVRDLAPPAKNCQLCALILRAIDYRGELETLPDQNKSSKLKLAYHVFKRARC